MAFPIKKSSAKKPAPAPKGKPGKKNYSMMKALMVGKGAC